MFNFDQIIGKSKVMRETVVLVKKIAKSEASSVLLQGESGTGKDLIAKAIHYGSHRAKSPFVAINCATLPANLIESELFGHEKGAFTDAKSRKEGLFEQAEGGTIFLDEIGELELSLQAKLLRVLEEGTFRRVGGLKDLHLNVRIVAASNRDLRAESEDGKFRLDLYYRLSVIQIDIAPLRERREDILPLVKHYISIFNGKFCKEVKDITSKVEKLFCSYEWPGNVRELRNYIERAMILEDGNMITSQYLPNHLVLIQETDNLILEQKPIVKSKNTYRVSNSNLFQLPYAGIDLEKVELSLVQQALDYSNGNQTRAAKLLGVSRDQLRYRLKKIEEFPIYTSHQHLGH